MYNTNNTPYQTTLAQPAQNKPLTVLKVLTIISYVLLFIGYIFEIVFFGYPFFPIALNYLIYISPSFAFLIALYVKNTKFPYMMVTTFALFAFSNLYLIITAATNGNMFYSQVTEYLILRILIILSSILAIISCCMKYKLKTFIYIQCSVNLLYWLYELITFGFYYFSFYSLLDILKITGFLLLHCCILYYTIIITKPTLQPASYQATSYQQPQVIEFSLEEKLTNLKNAYEQGHITDEQYAKLKADLLKTL